MTVAPPRPSLFSDDLLRGLIAMGHVDVLVGLPTLDHADSVGPVVRAVHEGLDRHFLRERTALLNADGGSTDGTPGEVQRASGGESATVSAPTGLRTTHRIVTPYHGVPGRGSALRLLFAAADLVQARAVVVLDPEVTSLAPDWIPALARPVLERGSDFVAPAFARDPAEAPLVTQLVAPLFRAAYGARLQEPLGGVFACSGRFAAEALARTPWEHEPVRDAPDPWLCAHAVAGGFRVVQAALGPHATAPRRNRPGLPEALRQVFGTLLHGLETHEAFWLARAGSEPVETLGAPCAPPDRAPAFDPESLASAFREGLADLAPVLAPVLGDGTLAELDACAARPGVPEIGPATWARAVCAFAAAHRHGGAQRDLLGQALVPLYLGRAAGFLARALRDPPAAAADIETLALAFEGEKPGLVRRWNPNHGR